MYAIYQKENVKIFTSLFYVPFQKNLCVCKMHENRARRLVCMFFYCLLWYLFDQSEWLLIITFWYTIMIILGLTSLFDNNTLQPIYSLIQSDFQNTCVKYWVFSGLSFLLTKQRMAMTGDLVNMQLFLKDKLK